MPKPKITILTLLSLLLVHCLQILAQTPVDSLRLMKHLQILSSEEMAGRKTGTDGSRKTREYIIREYEKAGLQPWRGKWEHSFQIDAKGYPKQGINVLGYMKGDSDSLVVVSAHYDHLGIKDKRIYFGADDNASGVAVLLEAARVLSTMESLPFSIAFAAFDAEEGGLAGAYAFVEDLQTQGLPVKFNLNMDMVSKGYKNELYVSGSYHYPRLKKYIDTTGTLYSRVQLKTGHDLPGTGHNDWTFSSDHGPFHKQKIPFLYFGVEDHPHYHQPTDTFDKTPYSFFLHVAETIIGFLNYYFDHERP